MIVEDICEAFFSLNNKPYFGKKELVYLSLLVNSWIDAILTAVPSVNNIIDARNELEFAHFIKWCYDNQNLLNWSAGISFLRYLTHLKKDIDDDTKKMLILFACSQWTYENKSKDSHLFVLYYEYKELIFCATKSKHARKSREVYIIKNRFVDFPFEHDCYYFSTNEDCNTIFNTSMLERL